MTFTDAAQDVIPWKAQEEKPKRADFKAWVDHICSIVLSGPKHENRRALFKSQLDAAWKFSNWLTHARSAVWHDAEAALSITESALTMCVSTIYRMTRDVPDQRPNCGSSRLRTEHAESPEEPGEIWERPACSKCARNGTATVAVLDEAIRNAPDFRDGVGEEALDRDLAGLVGNPIFEE